jgi:hypothetical protein
MIDRSRSDCEEVEFFTHHVGSIGASRIIIMIIITIKASTETGLEVNTEC